MRDTNLLTALPQHRTPDGVGRARVDPARPVASLPLSLLERLQFGLVLGRHGAHDVDGRSLRPGAQYASAPLRELAKEVGIGWEPVFG